MEAFGSAFDIIIVGALALPWVLLVIHLFFSTNEGSLEKLFGWVKSQDQPALVSVLLFAMAYPMGSAVSRIAQDFFDDDDLHLHLPIPGHESWIRLPMATETSIRTDVYCDVEKQIQKLPLSANVAPANGPGISPAASESASPCPDAQPQPTVKDREMWQAKQALDDLAERVFRFQEAAVLLQGTDDTERPRQFHDQIVVLRGAAFDGMIAFALCLFWWSAEFRSILRWASPLFLSLLGLNALYNHLTERSAADPPDMEFTLLVLAAAGWYVLAVRKPEAKPAPPAAKHIAQAKGVPRGAYLMLAAFLSSTAFLGWWATQVLYDQQVFYSYQALLQNQKPAAPPAK
jgi:hypothetical protein